MDAVLGMFGPVRPGFDIVTWGIMHLTYQHNACQLAWIGMGFIPAKPGCALGQCMIHIPAYMDFLAANHVIMNWHINLWYLLLGDM